jgi:hypothetical protein
MVHHRVAAEAFVGVGAKTNMTHMEPNLRRMQGCAANAPRGRHLPLRLPSFMFKRARGPWNRIFLLIVFWQLKQNYCALSARLEIAQILHTIT